MAHRWFIIPAIIVVLIAVGFFAFGNLNKNLVYYLTPTEALQQRADFPDGERFRLGGLVVDGSITTTPTGVSFQVTDGQSTIDVDNEGAPPQLFQGGAGAVVEGSWQGDRFVSDVLIVKHNEQYNAKDDKHEALVPPKGS
ncbi:cytochrome c-type biogenesis protein CcmE [bacterium BMS3Abin02]|nr:cytochrome c-type biogenesis protein CcmE [bacterium BMS3Abin02]GBE20961.1 cytochrome c-type biogenesis protein CcmE [bacterium BMS3Bbin01]HDH25334.1 cytochrome c maturation protein CcmE [Actinomycetota bacterium]HDK44748.1 cytochrome c maturation protein CcmE [Actinomycetota bacterium]HDL49586.1 cytochrome c maturation protein CcmE [Actinomycetota bacterium]